MDYFIGHSHALRLIREVRRTKGLRLVPCDVTEVAAWPAGRRFTWRKFVVPSVDSLSHFDSQLRPCLLAPDASTRFKARGVDSPVLAGRFPRGSFLRLECESIAAGLSANAYYVMSPGLCLVSAAEFLMRRVGATGDCKDSLIRLIALVMELCGSFVRDPRSPHSGKAVFWKGVFSSTAELGEQLSGICDANGIKLARRAVALSRDGSASPMETLHYAMFCLPPQLGGLGIPAAELNGIAQMGESSDGISHLREMKPDVSWPERRVAIEHLGSEGHCGKDALMLDARRIQDYQVAGWQVFPATFDDVRTQASFNAFARHVVFSLDPHGARGWWDRMQDLLADPGFRMRQARTLAQLLPPVAADE